MIYVSYKTWWSVHEWYLFSSFPITCMLCNAVFQFVDAFFFGLFLNTLYNDIIIHYIIKCILSIYNYVYGCVKSCDKKCISVIIYNYRF